MGKSVFIPNQSDFNPVVDEIDDEFGDEVEFPYRTGLILTVSKRGHQLLHKKFPYRTGLILRRVVRDYDELYLRVYEFPYRIGLILR
jgi:hypothetical protein